MQALLKVWRFFLDFISVGSPRILLGPLHRKLFKYLDDALSGRLGTFLFLVL